MVPKSVVMRTLFSLLCFSYSKKKSMALASVSSGNFCFVIKMESLTDAFLSGDF